MEDSEQRTEFPGGGIRDGAPKEDRFDLLWNQVQPYEDQPLTRYARWMARGAEKYEARNWEQFDSPEALEHAIGSAWRHFVKLIAGRTDEDHASAVHFNVDAIQVIRWKAEQALEVGTAAAAAITYETAIAPPEARYSLDTDGYVYRELKGQLTYVARKGARRRESTHESLDRYISSEGFMYDAKEIPIDEVPEWAR